MAPLHGSVFYTDDSPSPPSNPKLQGQYEGWKVTNNTGAPIDGAWVKLDTFNPGLSTSFIGLAPGEDGVQQLGNLAAGANSNSYFYLQASPSASDTNPQTHTVHVYDRRPDLPGATELCNTTYTYSQVLSAIQAAANKVTIATATSNPPGIGAVMTMTVSGDTGTIGSGEVTDPDSPFIQIGPATVINGASGISSWRPDVFDLISAKVQIDLGDGAGFAFHYDYLKWQFAPAATADRPYVIVYQFRIKGTTTAVTNPSPVQNISSGTQTKHTSFSSLAAVQPIQPPDNTTVLTKTASPTTVGNEVTNTVTYSVNISNSGAVSRTVSDGATTSGSTTVTSATANFTAADVGKSIAGTGLPTGAAIESVTNATTVVITSDATASGSGITFVIGSNQNVDLDDITDTLPAGVSYVSGSAEFGGASIADPVTVGSTLIFIGPFTIPSQASRTLTYEVAYPAGLAKGTYTNTVVGHIGSTQIDTTTDTANSSPATATVTVNSQAELSIVKTASEDPIPINGILVYTLQVTNAGPSPTEPTTVTDTTPLGTTPISASGTGWSCSTAGQIVTCSTPSVGVGAAEPIQVSVVVNATSGILTNTATVTSPDYDPDPSNNTDTITTTVNSSLAAVRGTYANGTWGSMDIFRATDGGVVDYYCCQTSDSWELRLPPSSCGAGDGYKIIYLPSDNSHQSQWLAGATNFTSATCISAPSVGNDMTIAASSLISGYVKDATTGADIDGAVVYSYRSSNGAYVGWSPAIVSGASGQPGRYSISLEGGESYKLLVQAPPGYEDLWYDGASGFGEATAVAAPATANFSLRPAGTISGNVTQLGIPQPGALVSVYTTCGCTSPKNAVTDASGNYSVKVTTTAASGWQYMVRVAPPAGQTRWYQDAVDFGSATPVSAPAGGIDQETPP